MTVRRWRVEPGVQPARWFVLGLSGFLLFQGLVGAVLKILGDRQDDLAHNLLHITSGLLGIWVCTAFVDKPALFALWFGAAYLGLALVGFIYPQGLIGTTLQLRLADQIFHTLVGLLSLGAGVRFGKRKEMQDGHLRRTT